MEFEGVGTTLGQYMVREGYISHNQLKFLERYLALKEAEYASAVLES